MKRVVYLLILTFFFLNSFSQENHSLLKSDSSYIDLGQDISLCDGYIHLLDAGPGFDSYIWQDGSINQTYMVTEAGTFWVHAYIGAAIHADTINIGYWPNPDPNLGNDTTLCYGSAYYLEPTAGYLSYLWQDGSTLPYYLVTDGGLYNVSVMDIHGCMASDTIYIDYTTSIVDLGSDTVICACGPLLLDAGEEFVSYEWQDGSQSQYFLVDFETFGLGYFDFSVSVVDSIGCDSKDSIHIVISECITNIKQISSEQLRIYPNPAYDLINIELPGLPDDKYSFEILNAYGTIVIRNERISTKIKSSISLDVSSLKSGIYYLKLKSNKKEYQNKLLIQN